MKTQPSNWNPFPATKPESDEQVVVFVLEPEQRAAFAIFGADKKFREVVKGQPSQIVLLHVSHWAEMPS